MTLSERDNKVIWHPYTQMQTTEPAIAIVRGEGVYLYDENGNRYIDAVSSWWVNLHGHSHPYIAQKVSEQLNTLEHVIFAGFTHPPAVELAERLLSVLPGNQSRVFYSDNGSTAVEVAIKMAFQFWHNQGKEKKKIIAFKDAYHGDTFGAMSISGRSAFTKPFQSLLFDVEFIDVPVKGKEEEVLESLKKLLTRDDIAAFIFEPLVLGTAGMLMYDASVLNKMVKLAKDYNVLTIADEVMTGFYRTGRYFASDYLDEQPDIFCLSKGITGGTMAFGVTTCTPAVFEAFLSDDPYKTFFHGHSYTANPLACAASLASMDLLKEKATLDNVRMISESHSEFAGKIRQLDILKEVRNTGTILAIELATEGGSNYFSSLKKQAYTFFMERKVLLRPLGNVIYIIPPYCISREDLNLVYGVISEFLDLIESAK